MAETLHLRAYQTECVEAIEAAWEEGMQRPAAVLSTGLGKGHPAYTEVPTPEGLRKWGDLRPGDHVFGSDGNPTRVLDVYDRGILPAYLIQFSDGSNVTVDGDHLWRVRDHKFKNTRAEVRVMSTADLVSSGLRHGRSHRFSVPMTDAVNRPRTALPIDPYTLGTLIANGCLTGSGTQLTTPDTEVIARVRLSCTANKVRDTTPGVCDRYSLPGLAPVLRSLGLNVLSSDKHIPSPYLEASVPDRISLLQGLMDCDGSFRSGGRRSVVYHTTSLRLAGDMVELVTSLGGTASPKWYRRDREGKISEECQVFILLPEHISAFGTSRRDRTEKPGRIFRPRRAVVSVTPAGNQKITCIRVEAEDSLYLITRHHIVTHNTVIFSSLIARHIGRTGTRAVVLVHRDELCDQAMAKIRGTDPSMKVGKVKASDNEVTADVVVASVQTLASRRRLDQLLSAGPVGLVVADEVHHYASRTFRGTLEGLGCFTSGGPVMAGFTATLERGDGIGLGSVVDDVVYSKGIMYGVQNGYLVRPEGRLIGSDALNLGSVKSSRGDYQAGDLGEALEESGLIDSIPGVYTEHAGDRQGIVFVPTVANASRCASALAGAGIASAMVCGDTPREERLRIFEEYRRGRIRVMTNAMVLTEGFDMPQASCAVIARPTQSQSLYVQMVGRVLRPFPGKTDAMILDVVGASVDNKLRTLIDLEEGLFPETKPCEECMRIPCACPCPDCGLRKKKCVCPKEMRELEGSRVSAGSVDLFAGSEHAWLLTRNGVMFIPSGEGEIFLWPSAEPGEWDVCYAPKSGKWERVRTGLPMGTAMAWAETEAEERTPFNAKKKAGWRRTKPSDAQIGFARNLGVRVTEDMKKGDVGNAISVALASRKFDRFMK